MSSKKNPRRIIKSKSQQIGERGERTFENQLDPSWVVNGTKQDFGIDFHVEVAEDGSPSGLTFVAQVKSEERPQHRNGGEYISCGLPRRHITYYTLKRIDPVFLIVCDVGNAECYYLFLQEAALSSPRKRTFRVPLANRVADTETFTREVCRAAAWMKERHPGSVRSAAQAEEARLNELDPRISHVLSHQAGQSHVDFIPREPVDFTLFVKADPQELRRFEEDVFDHGLPGTLDCMEASITGAPSLMDGGLKKLLVDPRSGPEISLAWTVETDAESCTTPEMSGVVRQGGKTSRVVASRTNFPLGVTVIFSLPLNGVAKVTWSCRLQSWAGQPLTELSYLPQMRRFYRLISQPGASLKLQAHQQGRPMLDAKVEIDDGMREWFQAYDAQLLALEHAEDACKILGWEPTFPGSFKEQDLLDLAELRALTSGERYLVSRSSSTSFVSSDGPDSGDLAELSELPKGAFIIESIGVGYDFLGQEFQLPATYTHFTKWKRSSISPADEGHHRFTIEEAEVWRSLHPPQGLEAPRTGAGLLREPSWEDHEPRD